MGLSSAFAYAIAFELSTIAVELSVTQQTPHIIQTILLDKSRRAELPHRAFQRCSRPQDVTFKRLHRLPAIWWLDPNQNWTFTSEQTMIYQDTPRFVRPQALYQRCFPLFLLACIEKKLEIDNHFF